MGVQTRRVGFPVCDVTSWSADSLAGFRGGVRSAWWHLKAVHALDFVNIRAKREGAELPLTSCVSLARDSAALLLDRTGTLRSFAANELALVQSMGVDVEGAFTNKLRNPRGEGGTLGVIGSGGVLPTNYSQPNAGVGTELIGTGSDSYGAYQDWRLFGTANSSSWRLRFENTANASASVGQSWGVDFGVKLLAGTPVSVTPEIVVAAGSTVLSTLSGNTVAPNASVQVAKALFTVSDATATNVRPQFRVNIANGATYDFTIRIYSPKLCPLVTQGYLPIFAILPPVGAPGDSTRAADVMQPATFAWFNNAGLGSACSELVAATFSHVADGVRRSLFEYSDGTGNNLICGSVNASDHVELSIVAGGVVQTVTALTSSIAAANGAYAFGWSATGGYVTNGSEVQTFGGVTLPSITQKRIGGSITYPALNDLLRQVQACTLLTSAEAMSWAASA